MPAVKPSPAAFAEAGRVAHELRQQVTEARAVRNAPWKHDTCPECGHDADVAIIVDPEEGLLGWECPECFTFVVTRDLIPDEVDA